MQTLNKETADFDRSFKPVIVIEKEKSFSLEEDLFALTRSLALHPFSVHVVVC